MCATAIHEIRSSSLLHIYSTCGIMYTYFVSMNCPSVSKVLLQVASVLYSLQDYTSLWLLCWKVNEITAKFFVGILKTFPYGSSPPNF